MVTAIYFLGFMQDGTHGFFQKQGIFHYFRAFKTETLYIYSLIWQTLTKTIIPLSVGDQQWIFTLPLHGSLQLGKYPLLVTSTSGDNCI